VAREDLGGAGVGAGVLAAARAQLAELVLGGEQARGEDAAAGLERGDVAGAGAGREGGEEEREADAEVGGQLGILRQRRRGLGSGRGGCVGRHSGRGSGLVPVVVE